MAGLVKEVELKILASDGDAQAKLDAIAERADALKEEHPELTVQIETAAAREKLAVLRDDFKETAAAADDLTKATADYDEAAARAAEASGKLAQVQADDAHSADDLAAAMDANAEATTRALDAQMRLLEAERRTAAGSKENADAQEASAAKTDEAAGAAGEAGHRLNELALGAAAVGVGAVYMGMKWQEASTQLVTGAGQSEAGLAKVKAGMLAVSTQTATSGSQIQAGMYMIESAGYRGAQGLMVLKAAAEGAKVGNAQLGDVANVVTSALNAYHLSAASATSITNQLVATVASGKMHMQDLATSISNVLPIAASAHISFAQVGGALATMTAQGMTARRASMNLANMIRAIIAPTAASSAEMKALGLNANEVSTSIGKVGLSGTLNTLSDAILRNTKGGSVLIGDMKDMTPAAQAVARQIAAGTISTKDLTTATDALSPQQAALVTAFAKSASSATGLKQTYDAAMKTMVGGATGLNVALLLSGKHMSTFEANTKAVGAAAAHSGADVTGWSKITADAGFKLEQAKTAAENMAVAVGSALLPAVTAILSPLASAAAWFADNKAAATALAVVVGGVLATYIGVKAVGAFKAVSSAVSDVGTGLQWLGTKLGILTGEQEAQTAATEAGTAAQEEADVAMDANPIGLIILAIAALIVVIVEVVKHWKDFKQWGADAWHAVADAAVAAWHFIDDDMIHPLEHGIADLVDWVGSHWRLLATIIGTVLLGPVGFVVSFVATHWSELVSLTSRMVSDVVGWFERLPGNILHALGDLGSLLWNAGVSLLEGLIHGIESEVGNVIHTVASIGSSILHSIEGALGIGSPSREMRWRGQMAGQGLALGLDDSIPLVMRSAQRLAAAAAAGGFTLAGGAAGGYGSGGVTGGGGTLRLEWVNGGAADQQFLTWLGNHIRIAGGSQDILKRKVVFA